MPYYLWLRRNADVDKALGIFNYARLPVFFPVPFTLENPCLEWFQAEGICLAGLSSVSFGRGWDGHKD